MREILFRGKRLDNGEWVEGDLYQYGDMRVIGWRSDDGRITTYPVIPDTVSEYTGLLDMNGKKIFEGDIVECWPGLTEHLRGVVENGVWNCSCCHGVFGWALSDGDLRDPDTSEVVGNIWDNKDLLGSETQEGSDR